MNIQEKINQIGQHLTGNLGNDREYLLLELMEAKKTKADLLILNAIYSFYYFCFAEREIDILQRIIIEDPYNANNLTIAIKSLIQTKNIDRAIYLARVGIDTIEEYFTKKEMYRPADGVEYRCFNNPIEEVLYALRNTKKVAMMKVDVNYSNLYAISGELNAETENYPQAIHDLEIALRWNPSNVDAIFSLAEVFRNKGDYEQYKDLNLSTLLYIYKKERLAKTYYHLGIYYVHHGDYETAHCLFVYSLGIHYSQDAKDSIAHMENLLGKQLDVPNANVIIATLKKAKIPLSVAPEVVEATYYLGKLNYTKNHHELAIKFLSLAYELSHHEEIKALLNKIKSRLN